VHRDGDLAFLEATLADSEGAVIATATATARVIALDQARSAAAQLRSWALSRAACRVRWSRSGRLGAARAASA
jgi:hypothetical protein